jgi:signal peptidase I
VSPALRKGIWGTIVGIAAVIAVLIVALIGAYGSGYVRNFYVPAEGMAPTLEKGDRFVALMDGGGDLKRGEIVLLTVGEAIYIKRIAALAGDTIGMSGGIVNLNGRPVAQRFLASEKRAEAPGSPTARRLAEQFPGEAAPHEILDTGPSPVDDFAETRVPPGFVFVLGDNRDRSADSRVSKADMGVELLPVADVKGRPLYCTKGCELGR